MSGRRRGRIGSPRRWKQGREDDGARRTHIQNWEFIGNLYFKELTRADEASKVGRHGGIGTKERDRGSVRRQQV